MIDISLTDRLAEKIKRAKSGEFIMPQPVELSNPVRFRCPHCGRVSILKKVMLQFWPDRDREKIGLVAVCPDCGCRKQIVADSHPNSPGVIGVNGSTPSASAPSGGGNQSSPSSPIPSSGGNHPIPSSPPLSNGGNQPTPNPQIPSGLGVIVSAVLLAILFVALLAVLLMKLEIIQPVWKPFPDKTDDYSDVTPSRDSNPDGEEVPEVEDMPLVDSEKKHSHYEVIKADVTWDNAETSCESRTYNGVSGHLAVITSQEEYDKVVSVLEDYIASHPSAKDLYYVWLGAWIDDADAENYIQNYKWVTGEDWTFDNWCYTTSEDGTIIEEPSFYDGELIENRLILWGYQRESLGWTFSDQNADLPLIYPPSKGEIGYICEYEEAE